jgi:phospholipid/cholesterol/gamma-HCH transport system substrate-binding protein
MARALAWRDLKVGTIALVAMVGLALSILFFARVGALHGDTTNIYVVTDDAPGVLPGTEVWLSGQKIGLVKDVHFRAFTTDTLERLAIHLQILSDQMHYIRKDAWADIRPGGNLIGSPVVFISSGTSNVRQLHEGDTLVEISTGMMRPVGDRVAALGARLGMLTDSGGKVLRLLQSQAGTAGHLVGSGWPKVTKQTDEIARLARNATHGEGTLASILNGELGAHVARIRAAKDSISVLMSTGRGNVGRFRSDSTLQKQIVHLRGELDSLRAEYSSGNGIGKVKTDSTLTIEMTRLRAQITALMADIKKHPLRYLK